MTTTIHEIQRAIDALEREKRKILNTVADGDKITRLYLRVSSTKQSREGMSIEAQAVRVINHCLQSGLPLTNPDAIRELATEYSFGRVSKARQDEIAQELLALHTYLDVESASKVDWFRRPMGQRLYCELRRGDTIVVAAFDRAFRSITDAIGTIGMLRKIGTNDMTVGLHVLDTGTAIDYGSAEGQVLSAMLAYAAQKETECRSARVTASIEQRRRKGRAASSHAPLGWKFIWDHTGTGTISVVPYPPMVEAIKTFCREYYLNGVRSPELRKRYCVPNATVKYFPFHTFKLRARHGLSTQIVERVDEWTPQRVWDVIVRARQQHPCANEYTVVKWDEATGTLKELY